MIENAFSKLKLSIIYKPMQQSYLINGRISMEDILPYFQKIQGKSGLETTFHSP